MGIIVDTDDIPEIKEALDRAEAEACRQGHLDIARRLIGHRFGAASL